MSSAPPPEGGDELIQCFVPSPIITLVVEHFPSGSTLAADVPFCTQCPSENVLAPPTFTSAHVMMTCAYFCLNH
jgi:hypothetical protein